MGEANGGELPGQGAVHHLAVRQLHREAPRQHQPEWDQHPGREYCGQRWNKGGVQCIQKVMLKRIQTQDCKIFFSSWAKTFSNSKI